MNKGVIYKPYNANTSLHFDFCHFMSFTQYFFKLVVGLKGIGKTYGAKTLMLNRAKYTGRRFVWLRGTQGECESVMQKADMFFADIAEIFPDDELSLEGGIFKMNGEDIGYLESLSTFYKGKGIDYSTVKTVIFDEAIPENAQNRQRGYMQKFAKMIKQIGRFRNLKTNPFDIICTANALDRGADIFATWNINVQKYGYYFKPSNHVMILYAEDSTQYKDASDKSIATMLFKNTEFDSTINKGDFEGDADNIIVKAKKSKITLIIHTSEGIFSIRRAETEPVEYYIMRAPSDSTYLNNRFTNEISLSTKTVRYDPKRIKGYLDYVKTRPVRYENSAIRSLFEWFTK